MSTPRSAGRMVWMDNTFDATLHWLLMHDPQRSLYDTDDEYARAVGIETPVVKNRQRREEVRFSDHRSGLPHHCGDCRARAENSANTVK